MTVLEMKARLAVLTARLAWANGEYAEILEEDIARLTRQIVAAESAA